MWKAFWTGGLSNPITVIAQMTYLLFTRRLDEIHIQREHKAQFLHQPIELPVYGPEEELKGLVQDIRHTIYRLEDAWWGNK